MRILRYLEKEKEMKIYITFGQDHIHKVNGITFDRNSVAEIGCKDYGQGREIAFELFGDKFFTSYNEEKITPELMSHFPRGIIKVER